MKPSGAVKQPKPKPASASKAIKKRSGGGIVVVHKGSKSAQKQSHIKDMLLKPAQDELASQRHVEVMEDDERSSSDDSNYEIPEINEKIIVDAAGDQGTASTSADKDLVGVEIRDSENEDFEVTPDSQIFEVLSSDGNS